MQTWFQLDQVYTAVGGEDKIYIGTFRPESELNPINVRPDGSPSYNSAYFYIDDVEVYEDTVTGVEETEFENVQLWYDQPQGRISLSSSKPVQINVYDLSGRGVRTGSDNIDVDGLSGIFLVEVIDLGIPVHVEKMVFVQ